MKKRVSWKWRGQLDLIWINVYRYMHFFSRVCLSVDRTIEWAVVGAAVRSVERKNGRAETFWLITDEPFILVPYTWYEHILLELFLINSIRWFRLMSLVLEGRTARWFFSWYILIFNANCKIIQSRLTRVTSTDSLFWQLICSPYTRSEEYNFY